MTITIACSKCGCKGIAEINAVALHNLNKSLLKEIKELKKHRNQLQDELIDKSDYEDLKQQIKRYRKFVDKERFEKNTK